MLLLVLSGCGAPSSAREIGRSAKSRLAVVDPLDDAKVNEPERRLAVVMGAVRAPTEEAARPACRPGMVSIEGRYCIDRYEASLVEQMPDGEERSFSPYSTVGAHHVRAVSVPGAYPQGYISATQAEQACAASGKRLCDPAEWQKACRGPESKRYGYGEQRERGRCNDTGKNPVVTLFGWRYDATTMNRPQLNQLDGTLAKTGAHESCSNGYGVYDMVGNLHEWVADPKGTFYGGYYQDVASVGHGDGCGYVTTAHEARYHDYSTGFRCCADPLGTETTIAAVPERPVPKSAPAKASKPARGAKKRH